MVEDFSCVLYQSRDHFNFFCFQTLVEVRITFVKILQVDTVNERYQADIFLQARWREPHLDNRGTSVVRRRFSFNLITILKIKKKYITCYIGAKCGTEKIIFIL